MMECPWEQYSYRILILYGNNGKSWSISVYFTCFGGSWSFALMTVPKKEKKILLSHYIPILCSLLRVAFIFSVTSYSPPWCKCFCFPWVSVGFPYGKGYLFFLFLPSVFLTSVPRISYGQTRIRSIVDCILLSLYLGMCLARCLPYWEGATDLQRVRLWTHLQWCECAFYTRRT